MPERMVALGDSVTAGIGDLPGPSGAVGWAAHVAEALAVRFANLARTGARAREVRDQQLPTAVSLRPALATLLVGGNDVLRRDFDIEEVSTAAAAVVAALSGSGSRVVVVALHGSWERLPLPRLLQRALARRVAMVNGALREIAGDHRALLLEPSQLAEVRSAAAWHADRVHPSPLGHRALARAALAALGCPAQRIPEPVATGRGRPGEAWWLVRHGLPWFAQRGAELAPGLAHLMLQECTRPRAPGPAVTLGGGQDAGTRGGAAWSTRSRGSAAVGTNVSACGGSWSSWRC